MPPPPPGVGRRATAVLLLAVPFSSCDTLCTALPSLCDGMYQPPILTVSHLGLSGTLPTQLAAAPRLAQVYAFGAKISGTLPPALGAARVLQELELSNCRVSGTLPPVLPGSLRFLRAGVFPPEETWVPTLAHRRCNSGLVKVKFAVNCGVITHHSQRCRRGAATRSCPHQASSELHHCREGP